MKRKILKYILKKLVTYLQPDYRETIFQIKTSEGTKIFIGEEEATKQDIDRLREEAKMISNTKVWKLINNFYRMKINDSLITKANNEDDIIFARAALIYHEDILNFLEELKK